jgi:hypothetical protein
MLLKLRYEEPISNFAFNINSRRYETEPTEANAVSSRSHAVLEIQVRQPIRPCATNPTM